MGIPRPLAYAIVCLAASAQAWAADAASLGKMLDHAAALNKEGKSTLAEQEYSAVAALARQLHNRSIEANAVGNIGYLQYYRGAMADALTNLQNAYRLSVQLG